MPAILEPKDYERWLGEKPRRATSNLRVPDSYCTSYEFQQRRANQFVLSTQIHGFRQLDSANGAHMYFSQLRYLPLTLPFFSILVGLLILLIVLVQIEALHYVYMQRG
jgi:hypothetical protein